MDVPLFNFIRQHVCRDDHGLHVVVPICNNGIHFVQHPVPGIFRAEIIQYQDSDILDALFELPKLGIVSVATHGNHCVEQLRHRDEIHSKPLPQSLTGNAHRKRRFHSANLSKEEEAFPGCCIRLDMPRILVRLHCHGPHILRASTIGKRLEAASVVPFRYPRLLHRFQQIALLLWLGRP